MEKSSSVYVTTESAWIPSGPGKCSSPFVGGIPLRNSRTAESVCRSAERSSIVTPEGSGSTRTARPGRTLDSRSGSRSSTRARIRHPQILNIGPSASDRQIGRSGVEVRILAIRGNHGGMMSQVGIPAVVPEAQWVFPSCFRRVVVRSIRFGSSRVGNRWGDVRAVSRGRRLANPRMV